MGGKAGIFTLYRNNRNYGGQLQAWAMCRLMERMGYAAEIVDYREDKRVYLLRRFRNIGIASSLKIAFGKLHTAVQIRRNRLGDHIAVRNACFSRFENETPHSGPVRKPELDALHREYDVFVCGSDQIWNPGLHNDAFFLDFPSGGKPRLSYAASVGRATLTEGEERHIAEKLRGLDSISVREKDAEAIVRQLTDKPVRTVLDPTLMLSEQEWLSIARKPEGCPDEYFLSFFLGRNPNNRAVRKEMAGIAHKRGFSVVSLPHLQTGYKKDDERHSDVRLYNVGPREWLWLLKHARCVFTDSFHGTALSLHFRVPFWAFAREDAKRSVCINSRLYCLLDDCGLVGRYVSEPVRLANCWEEPIDFDRAALAVDALREESFSFLQNALEPSAG